MKLRLGEFGWVLALAGLPWSFFIIRQIQPFSHLDLWHANTWWMQGWTFGMLAWQGLSGRTLPRALWTLLCWPTFLILWSFTAQSKSGSGYPAHLLLGLSHLWFIGLLLLLMTAWSPHTLQRILHACFWSGLVLVGYGWLQVANLDQFFHSINLAMRTDSVVGTIGNPTHLACQLALWSPLALMQPGWRKLWVLPAYGLLLVASSATAFVTAGLLLVGFLWSHQIRFPRVGWAGLGLGGIVTACGFTLTHSWTTWLNPYGRWETWSAWWELLIKRPILGYGLGFVKFGAQQLPATHPLFGWKHLHNEYLQWWVETGFIGVLLLVWALWTLWQRRSQGEHSKVRWACGAMLMGSLLVACLNFNWHLWQLGIYGLVGLAGWLICTDAKGSHGEPHYA